MGLSYSAPYFPTYANQAVFARTVPSELVEIFKIAPQVSLKLPTAGIAHEPCQHALTVGWIAPHVSDMNVLIPTRVKPLPERLPIWHGAENV
jgi:hypothetical protein